MVAGMSVSERAGGGGRVQRSLVALSQRFDAATFQNGTQLSQGLGGCSDDVDEGLAERQRTIRSHR